MQTNNNNIPTNIFDDACAANEKNFIEVRCGLPDVLKKAKEEEEEDESEEDELAKLNESCYKMLQEESEEGAEQVCYNVCITCGNKSESHTVFCKSECESEFLFKGQEKEEEEEEEPEDLDAEGEYHEYITSCIFCGDKIEENTGFCGPYCSQEYQRHHSDILYTKYGKF